MAKSKDDTTTPERSNVRKQRDGIPHWLRKEFVKPKPGGVAR